jgi:outer membrane protein, heavy metal efflux system
VAGAAEGAAQGGAMTARVVTALIATAVAPGAAALSLSEAQTEARAHAPERAELDARLRAAQLSAEAASRVLRSNPSLTGTYAPGALSGHPDEQSWEVELSQKFDVSGSWSPRGRSAAADRDRVAQQREEGLRTLDEAVAIAVAEVARAQRAAERAGRIAKLQEIAAQAAQKELEVGQGNQLDVDAAGLALAAARANVPRAEGDLASARARLARLLGRVESGDLVVDEAGAAAPPPPLVSMAAVVDGAPQVRAADAEVRAARLELAAWERSAWPEVTLGAFYAQTRRDIPAGALHGPASTGLSASWTDAEFGFRAGFPLPLFDRRQPERAAAAGRVVVAEALVTKARAEVREQVGSAWAALTAARRAFDALADTPRVVDREFALVEKSFRLGALDAVARAVATRTIQDASATYDGALRDLRVAEARWQRWTAAEK